MLIIYMEKQADKQTAEVITFGRCLVNSAVVNSVSLFMVDAGLL